jgi:hypothetical protein
MEDRGTETEEERVLERMKGKGKGIDGARERLERADTLKGQRKGSETERKVDILKRKKGKE